MSSIINLPDFNLKESKVPDVKIKEIHFQNYKVFEDYKISFQTDKSIQSFSCFIGPNGCGKTTILDVIQLIFSRFEGMGSDRLDKLLGKAVRHANSKRKGICGDDDFLITAKINSSIGDYEIKINKNGFIKNHPEEIRSLVYRLCFYARFDNELRTFQLERNKWPIFKKLFEAVTGFEVEEVESVFDQSDDPVQSEMLSKYILSFNIHKPDETISHIESSAGERKIIKSFSTLLNKEYSPKIILIDNVAMHVESGRHLELIQSMKKCFPKSQIFSTTHSFSISRNFGERSELHDLRLIKSPNLIKQNPWRLYLIDEIKDAIVKLNSIILNGSNVASDINRYVDKGRKLIQDLMYNNANDVIVVSEVELFLKDVSVFFIQDIVKYYKWGKCNGS